jgi:hypothetical protein
MALPDLKIGPILTRQLHEHQLRAWKGPNKSDDFVSLCLLLIRLGRVTPLTRERYCRQFQSCPSEQLLQPPRLTIVSEHEHLRLNAGKTSIGGNRHDVVKSAAVSFTAHLPAIGLASEPNISG